MLRESPSSAALRDAFRLEARRRQRQSDGTISLDGLRFEIPSRFRHFRDVVVRYARWDLSRVDLVNPRTVRCWPRCTLSTARANADGRRAVVEPVGHAGPLPSSQQTGTLPPLLQKILADYSATGLPPAYLPQKPHPEPEGEAS